MKVDRDEHVCLPMVDKHLEKEAIVPVAIWIRQPKLVLFGAATHQPAAMRTDFNPLRVVLDAFNGRVGGGHADGVACCVVLRRSADSTGKNRTSSVTATGQK